jgi:predicted transposase YbfD/YdcC
MLGEVVDPRCARGVRHRLPAILTVTVFAVLTGARNYRQIGDRVSDLPQRLLALAGARSHPALGVYSAPSGDTIRRVLVLLDARELDRLVGSWLRTVIAAGRSDADPSGREVAMDGKFVRDAWSLDGEVCLFSAMDQEHSIVIAQVLVPMDTTEVTCVRDLLSGMDLTGWVITADAAHTCADTARFLVAEHADYVLPVKGNREVLERSIAALMPAMLAGTADWVGEENRGGDTIRRSIWVVDAEGVDFPGAVRAFRLLRERFDPFGVRVGKEVVHGVTSLSARKATAREIADRVRSHWKIENRVHWPRDAVFGEDVQGAWVGAGPQSMAIVRNLALALMRLAGVGQVRRLTESIAADRMRILPVLAAALEK